MATEVNDVSFEQEVLQSDKPVLVDFWAAWCGPCRVVKPIVEELAKEYEGRAKVVKVDVDACPETSEKFGIRNIPTLLYFKDGKIVDKLVGAANKNTLVEKLDALL